MQERTSIAGVGRAVMVLLGLIIIADIISIASSAMQLDLLASFADGAYDEAAAEANDNREMAVGIGYIGLYIVTAVTFLVWFHRAYRNIDAFGGVRSSSTASAVWGYIVPIISLYKPYQLTREAFTVSIPQGDHRMPLVKAWWALFLLNNLAGQVAFRLARNAETLDDLVTMTQASLASNLVDMPSAVLAIMVVRTLTDAQENRAPGEQNMARVFD